MTIMPKTLVWTSISTLLFNNIRYMFVVIVLSGFLFVYEIRFFGEYIASYKTPSYN